jgi:hypothetical protein
MFKYWSKKRIITVLVFFIILSGILSLPVIYSLSDRFSKTARVNANILLVEGWLTPHEIDMAYKEFKNNGYSYIVTSGLRLPDEYNNGILNVRRKIINNYNSDAELARKRFLSMGIDSSLIVAIPCQRVRFNKTLTSALAVRDWLRTTNIKVKGINIVTLGPHAERTFMTYNKILDKKYDIGIISLPDYKVDHSRRYKVLITLRETFKIIYYWFILLPY